MKFWNIAVFMLILNITAGILFATGMFGAGFGKTEKGVQAEEDIESGFSKVKDTAEQSTGILGSLNFLVQQVELVVNAVSIFLKVMINAIMVKPLFNNIFATVGMKMEGPLQTLVDALTIIVQLTYVIGAVQLLSGRNIEQMA